MSSRQTVHCSTGNIRACRSTDKVLRITAFVLPDATFGHRQPEFGHVRRPIMLSDSQ